MDKLTGLLGISVRAGQAIFGEDSCMKALRAGQCAALVIDAALSQTVKEKYAGVCQRANVPMAELPEGALDLATGKSAMAAAIRKGPLGDNIRKLIMVPGNGESGLKNDR